MFLVANPNWNFLPIKSWLSKIYVWAVMIVMAQIILLSCNWNFPHDPFRIKIYDLLLGKSIQWEITEMMSAKSLDPLRKKHGPRNARDTWAINPFLDIDKRQIMSPARHVKYINKKKEKKKKREITLYLNGSKNTLSTCGLKIERFTTFL